MRRKIMNRAAAWLAVVAVVLSLVQGLIPPTLAEAAPGALIASVAASPKLAGVGDSVEVTVALSAIVADAPGPLTVSYAHQASGSGLALELVKGSDGLFRGSLTLDQRVKTGVYQISGIDILHQDGSTNEVYNSRLYPTQAGVEDLGGGDFTVDNPNQDLTPPVVTSVAVDKQTVLLGDTVTITARASDVGLGIDGSIKANYRISPDSGREVILNPMGDGTFTGTLSTRAGDPIGNWFLSSLSLRDKGGNTTTIENAARSTDPGSATKMNLDHCDLTVHLATGPDSTPPVIEALTIDKTLVTKGATIRMTLKVADQSAIDPIIVGSYHAPDYATYTFHEEQIFRFGPSTDGVYTATFNLGSTIGNWVFGGLTVKDLAGNETTLNNKKLTVDGTGDDLSRYEITMGHKVAFDSQGGSAVTFQITPTGFVSEPPAPTKAGVWFSGWYTNPLFSTQWNFTRDKVTADSTLYARWVDSPDQIEVPEFPYFATTTANSLNMRKGPTSWYPVITTIPKGTIVKVIYKDNNWFQIDWQGTKGYVSSTYILKADQDLIYQASSNINFRTGPSTAYPVIRKLPLGTYVELVARTSATWWKIRVNGTTGYVSATYLVKSGASQAPPPVPEPTQSSGYIVKSPVNFRTAPLATAPLIRKLAVGTPLQLIAKVDAAWWKVSVNNQIGYLSSKYVESMVFPIQKYVNTTSLNLRTGPSTAYSIITKLPQGAVFTLVKKTSDTWWRVTVNGYIGYASAKYLSFMPGVE